MLNLFGLFYKKLKTKDDLDWISCNTIVVVVVIFINYKNVRAIISVSHDVMAAILLVQNSDMAAMLVYQSNPVGDERFSYVNAFSCFNKCAWLLKYPKIRITCKNVCGREICLSIYLCTCLRCRSACHGFYDFDG